MCVLREEKYAKDVNLGGFLACCSLHSQAVCIAAGEWPRGRETWSASSVLWGESSQVWPQALATTWVIDWSEAIQPVLASLMARLGVTKLYGTLKRNLLLPD